MSDVSDPFALENLIEVPQSGSDKLATCKFRSETEESRFIKTCHCADAAELKGYYCSAHDIFQIKEDFCQFCKKYENKNG